MLVTEHAEKVRPARPQRVKGRSVHFLTRPPRAVEQLFPEPYVEALSDARTTLEGFCNMLKLWYVSPWVSRPFYC
jgi:hypothetical protein